MRELYYEVYIEEKKVADLRQDLEKISDVKAQVWPKPTDSTRVVIPVEASILKGSSSRKRRSIEQAIKKREGKIVGDMKPFQDISRKDELSDFFDKNAAGLVFAWIAAFSTGTISAFTSDFTKALSPAFPWQYFIPLTIGVAIGNVYTTQKEQA